MTDDTGMAGEVQALAKSTAQNAVDLGNSALDIPRELAADILSDVETALNGLAKFVGQLSKTLTG